MNTEEIKAKVKEIIQTIPTLTCSFWIMSRALARKPSLKDTVKNEIRAKLSDEIAKKIIWTESESPERDETFLTGRVYVFTDKELSDLIITCVKTGVDHACEQMESMMK